MEFITTRRYVRVDEKHLIEALKKIQSYGAIQNNEDDRKYEYRNVDLVLYDYGWKREWEIGFDMSWTKVKQLMSELESIVGNGKSTLKVRKK